MKKVFRRTLYRHGLYQYALLLITACGTRFLACHTTLSGQTASVVASGRDLGRFCGKCRKVSVQYTINRHSDLDETLAPTVQVVIKKLQRRQELLDHVRAYGWSEDTLRLALDVAG
jgi:hypothetical protein